MIPQPCKRKCGNVTNLKGGVCPTCLGTHPQNFRNKNRVGRTKFRGEAYLTKTYGGK